MEPRRFQLEGPSLDALKAKVLAEHGPRARIIAAEKVTVGGIGGFLSRHHYEVTVELPPSGRRRAPVEPDLPSRASMARAGISALLEEAERAESTLHPAAPAAPAGPAAPAPAVSTGSFAFAELMDNISASTGAPTAPPAPQVPAVPVQADARLYPPPLNQGRINQGLEPERRAAVPPAPAPLGNAGDLVMVVGLGDEPLDVCRSMAELAGSGAAAVRVAGALETDGVGRAADRRAVATARAAGVMAGHSIYLAYGLGRSGTEMARHATLIAALAADQVWVVVDAGRKPEDTAAWVGAVRNAVPVDAAAVEGIDTTGTPQSVNALNLPIGWLDGEPSPSPVL